MFGLANELQHHGIPGQKWGVRNGPPYPLKVAFISGSWKTSDPSSVYYRKVLPKPIRDSIDKLINSNARIVVADAPGVDRQTQDYLKEKNYKNVNVYGPGEIRYLADKDWKTKSVGSMEDKTEKDRAMADISTCGIAVVIEKGSGATRDNIRRLNSQGKKVKVYQLNEDGTEGFIAVDEDFLKIVY